MSAQLRLVKNEYVEDRTAQRLREYEAKANLTVTLPIPIEQVVEQTLDLSILWDTVEEQPGETILGGLLPKARRIVLNEKHLPLFDKKPGLLRSTIGHEAGHWDIDVDKVQSLPLFADSDESVVYRQGLCTKSPVFLRLFVQGAILHKKSVITASESGQNDKRHPLHFCQPASLPSGCDEPPPMTISPRSSSSRKSGRIPSSNIS